jgi:hypothetical protein
MNEYSIQHVTTADIDTTVPTTYTLSTEDPQVSNSGSLVSNDNDHQTASFHTSPMEWYLLIIITVWLFSAIAGTIVVICYTKSIVSVALFTTIAPPVYILYWIVKQVFSEPETITKLRIKTKAQRPTFRLPKWN